MIYVVYIYMCIYDYMYICIYVYYCTCIHILIHYQYRIVHSM